MAEACCRLTRDIPKADSLDPGDQCIAQRKYPFDKTAYLSNVVYVLR